MSKQVEIKIGSFEDAAKGFVEAWQKAEQGKPARHRDILMFDNIETLLKTLTPNRFNVLKYIHSHGHLSIRHVSKQLKREYANVYRDVQTLYDTGLLLKDEDKKFYAPWGTLKAELQI